jgi:uncharacterized protein
MTDYGLPEEAAILAQDLKAYVRIPCVANHDFESGKILEVQSILAETRLHILDGESVEFLGTGFAGVCVFGGGFDRQMLNPWGEPMIKAFVQEALDHSLRLERALNHHGSASGAFALLAHPRDSPRRKSGNLSLLGFKPTREPD